MAGEIEARLRKNGIILPEPAIPQANYIGFTITGNLIFPSGQLPIVDGKLGWVGKLGRDFTIEEGYLAAKAAAINVLAQVRQATGDLDRVTRCIKLTGLVNSVADFNDPHRVVNGASDLMVEALGDAGRHARTAFSVASLPLGAAVEIEAIFEFR